MTRRFNAPPKNDRSVWVSFLLHRAYPKVPVSWLETFQEDPTAESLFTLVADDYFEETPLEVELAEDGTLSPVCKNAVLALVQQAIELIKELESLNSDDLKSRYLDAKDSSTPEMSPISPTRLEEVFKARYWTAHDAAVLSLGLDPAILTPERCQSLVSSPKAGLVRKRKETLERAIEANDLTRSFSPKSYFSWAEDAGVAVDQSVRSKAVELGFAEAVSLIDQLTAADAKIARLKIELAAAQKALKLSLQTEADVKVLSLRSLRRIALGLAIRHHSGRSRSYNHLNIASVVKALAEVESYQVKQDAVASCLKTAHTALGSE